MVELDHLSYSSISTYQTCPRSWKFRYVDKVKLPVAPALAFGSAFHGTVEEIVRAQYLGHQYDTAAIWAEKWGAATQQEIAWDGTLPEHLGNEGLRMLTHASTVETLTVLIRPLVEDGEPVIERRIELKIPDVPIPVIGYIDIIAEDGVPMDFKTSSKSWTEDQASREVQPIFYLAALNQAGWIHNPDYRFRHIVFVKTRTPQVQIIESKHGIGAMLWLTKMISDVWRSIENESFPPNPSSWKCGPKYCEYHGMCRGRP